MHIDGFISFGRPFVAQPTSDSIRNEIVLSACANSEKSIKVGKINFSYPIENTALPWNIACMRTFYIAAAKWVLSDKGGKVWRHTKNDIVILDYTRKVDLDHLQHVLKHAGDEHGWSPDDIATCPRSSASRELGAL